MTVLKSVSFYDKKPHTVGIVGTLIIEFEIKFSEFPGLENFM